MSAITWVTCFFYNTQNFYFHLHDKSIQKIVQSYFPNGSVVLLWNPIDERDITHLKFLTSTSAVSVSISCCLASSPMCIFVPSFIKSLSFKVGKSFSSSFTDASRSTVEPLRSYFLKRIESFRWHTFSHTKKSSIWKGGRNLIYITKQRIISYNDKAIIKPM